MVEKRHLEYWIRLQSAREQARSAVPAAWITDPRPEMREVVDAYVEAMVRHSSERRSTRLKPVPAEAAASAPNSNVVSLVLAEPRLA